MQPRRGNHELRQQLKELLQEADRLAALIQQAEAPGRHASDRPRLRLIRGGKAIVLAPVLWLAGHLRDPALAKAAGVAAVGVVAVPTGLGISTADADIGYNPPPRSTMTTTVNDEQQELHRPQLPPPPRPASSPAPLPSATVEAAGTVESGGSPPDPPAPVSAPTPTPTPTPTLPVDEVVDPVEEVVWTKATALVHCRDVLLVLPTDLQDCVRDLLAG